MITRHRLVSILLCVAIACVPARSQDEFVNCYAEDGVATRCEPESETFSLSKIPVVNSTCGSLPSEYCAVESYSISQDGQITVDSVACGLVCDEASESDAHPPPQMTDFFSPHEAEDTWWQSETFTDSAADVVVIDLPLGTLVQVSTIIFRFRSLLPEGFYILKSSDFTPADQLLHLLAADCDSKYQIMSEVDLGLENETTVLCQPYDSLSPDRINFVPTLNRPSDRDDAPGYSDALYQFATVTNIRVVLDGLLTDGLVNDSFSYYALRDLSVVGKCQCWGHARNCTRKTGSDEYVCQCWHNTAGANCERCLDLYNDLPWPIANGGNGTNECKECECNGRASSCIFDQELFEKSGNVSGGRCVDCTGNTVGPRCDECAEFFYHDPSLPSDSTDFCQPCNCHLAGVTNDGDCERDGNDVGQCFCKANVTGRLCDQCKEGHYDLQDDNPDGCTACSCNSSLSVSKSCDNITGACFCANNAIGDDCSSCAPTFFLSPDQSSCVPCDCDPGGSLFDYCDLDTGQCVCRNGVVGRTCSEPSPGYYFPFIDQLFLMEAEESLGLSNISYRKSPGSMDPKTFTGAGFASIDDEVAIIHIGEFVPAVGGTYEFVVRYNLPSTWSQIELRVDVGEEEGSGPPTTCSEYNGDSQVFFYNLTVGMTQVVSVQLCLRAGRSYSLNLNGFVQGSSTDPLLVDSLVTFLIESEMMTTLSLPTVNALYHSCVDDYKSLATQVEPVITDCEGTAFSVFTEYYNSTLPCDCDPDGTTDSLCEPYGGQCLCKPNFTGRQCDSCVVGTYGLHFFSTPQCIACDCSVNGSVDDFCNQFNGQCTCRPNISGRDCSSCDDGFYSSDASLDCQACGCDVDGSVHQICDKATGECPCIQNVSGEKCSQCQINHFDFPNCLDCGCSAQGSSSLQCDEDDGLCSCKSNAQGDKCSECVDGTFNVQAQNPDGCQPCYCSGLPVPCSSSGGYVSVEVFSDFLSEGHGWTSLTPGVDITSGVIEASDSVYLAAPNEFLGNKLSSYGQFLSVNISVMGSLLTPSGYDVVLASEEVQLGANFVQMKAGPQVASIQLYESWGWFSVETGEPASTDDLQSVLFDLTELRVQVGYGTLVQVNSIALQSAEAASGGDAGWVEQCECPPTHAGLSCERCSMGHYREADGSCVPCQCNGFSSTCDETSGVCIDCLDNTAGDHCQVCAAGFYGDPPNGVSCEPCPCPLTSDPGQFSKSCMEVDGDVVCTDCPVGHAGDQCEECAAGFFGDPTGVESGMATSCSNCSCNNNVDLTDPDSCNKTTGVCQKCLFNTTGPSCQHCLENYFGDPLVAKDCTDCECNPLGSASLQCNSFGQCLCRLGVSGSKCGECELNHFNMTIDGCQPCNCDPNGSSHTSCDPVTGQCTCRPGVEGRRCDECMLGYYDLSTDGCKDCGCHEEGSLSSQCHANGSCMCREGVMGTKCSQCQENYLLLSNGTCDACPDCYWQLKADVDSTRSHLESTRDNVNSAAEKNDFTTTFHEKITTAQSLVDQANASALALGEEYFELDEKLTQLEEEVSELETVTVPEVQLQLISVQSAASPIIGLADSSVNIMNRISQELNDSIDVILMIMNKLPTFENLASMTLASEQNGSVAVSQLESHVQMMQSDLETIANVTAMAITVANQSLDAAGQVVSLFAYNLAALVDLEADANNFTSLVTKLQNNLSMLKLDLMISENELNVLSATNLAIAPDSAYLSSLQNIANQALANASSDLAEIQFAEELLGNLSHSLLYLCQSFNATQAELHAILYQINNFSSELLARDLVSADATTQANMCISQAEYILSALQNFSKALAEMEAEADKALLSVTMIKQFAEAVNITLQQTIGELQNANDSLSQGLPLSVEVNVIADQLLEAISELDSNLTATLAEISVQLGTAQEGLATLQSQQVKANDSLNQLLGTKEAVNQASLAVESQSSLPTEAATISANASALVSQLLDTISSTPEPDFDAIEEVTMDLESVSQQLNEADLEATRSALASQLQQLDSELSKLKNSLSTITEEVEELQQLTESLPPDCDSNY